MIKDKILDEQKLISHKTNLGKVFYDSQGISLITTFGLNKLTVNWEDINFCSLTPSVEKQENEWIDFRGNNLESLKFLKIQIALKNRHHLLKKANALVKIWLISILKLSALFGANDKPLPKKGVFTINVKLKSLSVDRIEFVEFLSQKSKFDIIINF